MENNKEDIKFDFARDWCGYEVWELKDNQNRVIGDVQVKKTDKFFVIYSINVVDQKNWNKGYASYMYKQIKSEAIGRGCKWIIGEWAEIYEGNKHFIKKLINKEGFRLITQEEIEKIGFKPDKPFCYIKEL